MSRAGTARPIPTGTLLLTRIRSLATFNYSLGEITGAAVYVEGNVIKWVGKMENLPAELTTADRVLDMSAHVVLPGTFRHCSL
jgi:imidazolonepropionase-like amidohydrolase